MIIFGWVASHEFWYSEKMSSYAASSMPAVLSVRVWCSLQVMTMLLISSTFNHCLKMSFPKKQGIILDVLRVYIWLQEKFIWHLNSMTVQKVRSSFFQKYEAKCPTSLPGSYAGVEVGWLQGKARSLFLIPPLFLRLAWTHRCHHWWIKPLSRWSCTVYILYSIYIYIYTGF